MRKRKSNDLYGSVAPGTIWTGPKANLYPDDYACNWILGNSENDLSSFIGTYKAAKEEAARLWPQDKNFRVS